MPQEEKSTTETIDSIQYLDELTGAADTEEDEPEQAEAAETEAKTADAGSHYESGSVREEYVRPYASGYSPLPEQRKQVPFWKRTMSFANTAVIGILTFAIGLAAAGAAAKSRISDLNEQLAQKEEQIQTLEEQNAELQEKLDSLPLNGDSYNYDFGEFFEQFGELFGDYGSWFGIPDDSGENVFPVPSNHGYLGIRVEETGDGVRVVETLPNAKTDVFEKDDIILEVDGTKVKTIDDISKVLDQTEQGDTVEVLVKRGDAEKTLDVELTGRYQEPVELTPGNSQEF